MRLCCVPAVYSSLGFCLTFLLPPVPVLECDPIAPRSVLHQSERIVALERAAGRQREPFRLLQHGYRVLEFPVREHGHVHVLNGAYLREKSGKLHVRHPQFSQTLHVLG